MSLLFFLISAILTTVHPWVLQSTHIQIDYSQTDDVSLRCFFSDPFNNATLNFEQVTRIQIQKKDNTNSWKTYAEVTSSDVSKVKLTTGNVVGVKASGHVGFSSETFLSIIWSSPFTGILGRYVCGVDGIVNGLHIHVDTKEIAISFESPNKVLMDILGIMSRELESVKDQMESLTIESVKHRICVSSELNSVKEDMKFLKNESVNHGISMSDELKSVKDEMKSLRNESVNRGIFMSNELKSVTDEMESLKNEISMSNELKSVTDEIMESLKNGSVNHEISMCNEMESVTYEMESLKNESVNHGIIMSNELKSVKDEMESLKNESVNHGISVSHELKSVKDEMETSKGVLTNNMNTLQYINEKFDRMYRDMKTIQDTMMTAINPCPAGWSYYSPLHTCIRVYHRELNWTNARKYCQGQNGDLVKIHNEHMKTFVTGFVPSGLAWIGLNDRNQEGRFVWLDEYEKIKYMYENWKGTEPDNYKSKEHCVVMDTVGTWRDVFCTYTWNFVCQIVLK